MAGKKKFPWAAGQGAVQNAAEVLPSFAEAFFAQGRTLTPQVTPEVLQNFRTQTKRFRDTLELFRPCYNLRLERLLNLLRGVHQILGEINDLATARAMLVDRGFAKSKQGVLDSLDARMAEKAAQFFSTWRESFVHEEQERRWVTYLARAASQPTKPAHKAGRR